MARCCGGASCECVIAQGDNVTVTGIGTPEDPYIVAAEASLTMTALAQLVQWARNPDQIIVGAITRDANEAATSAPVVWPDGTPGTYTADTVSVAFPGAVDAYHVTYGAPVTKTFTQPAVTRDASGAVTNLPAIVVT